MYLNVFFYFSLQLKELFHLINLTKYIQMYLLYLFEMYGALLSFK